MLLVVPSEVSANGYVVHRGDTLAEIAKREHVSVRTLVQANRIANANLIRVGQRIFVPGADSTGAYGRTTRYRVRWGDTLSGLAVRFGLSITSIRSMNPELGRYPLAGQWLRLRGGRFSVLQTFAASHHCFDYTIKGYYRIRAGDNLATIAMRHGVSTAVLLAVNHIANPNRIITGRLLRLPTAWDLRYLTRAQPYRRVYRAPVTTYQPSQARVLITEYARIYGLSPSLPLAVAWQESGFDQAVVSPTGAIGVMQVEPYTGRHVSSLTGQRFNLYLLNDNVKAGVFWLSRLLTYYGGNERLAAAAYYQGTKSLARRGFFRDTVRYVNNVMSLKAGFNR